MHVPFYNLWVVQTHVLGQVPEAVALGLQRVLGVALLLERPEGLENLGLDGAGPACGGAGRI